MKTASVNHLILQFALVFLLVLPSCVERGSSGDQAENGSEIIKKEVILSPHTQEMLNHFPSPLAVTLMLRSAKASYMPVLTNPPDNLSRYFTEKTKALNLGIYSADLAYASVYQRSDETSKFLFCTGKLADDLGIGQVYNKELLKKAEGFRDNRDSLVALATRFGRETTDFLRRNNRTQVAVLAASGAFTEGLYIAVSLYQLSPANASLKSGIQSQQESLDNLLLILDEFGEDVNVKPLAAELAKLKPVFAAFATQPGKFPGQSEIAWAADITGRVRANMIR